MSVWAEVRGIFNTVLGEGEEESIASALDGVFVELAAFPQLIYTQLLQEKGCKRVEGYMNMLNGSFISKSSDGLCISWQKGVSGIPSHEVVLRTGFELDKYFKVLDAEATRYFKDSNGEGCCKE